MWDLGTICMGRNRGLRDLSSICQKKFSSNHLEILEDFTYVFHCSSLNRYYGKIEGNISLNNGISWEGGGQAPQTPQWVSKGPGAREGPKKQIFRSVSRPH